MTLQAIAPTPPIRWRCAAMPMCPQCGDTVLAPEISEHLSPRHVRHTWSCDACGYGFETLVDVSRARRG